MLSLSSGSVQSARIQRAAIQSVRTTMSRPIESPRWSC
jgi:hypothetical protein